jgi:hypothetical protein
LQEEIAFLVDFFCRQNLYNNEFIFANMTSDQQKKMISTGRLILNKKRLFKHYEALVYFGLPMGIALVGFIILQIQDDSGNIISPKLVLLILPLMGISIFFNQYFGLRFTKLSTTLPKDQSYERAKETIRELKWNLNVDNKGFLEAFNPISDFRTWGDEMISIVIDENQIFINSICNVDDSISQAGLSFGKNRQNIKRFCKIFSSIEESK